MGTLRLDGLDLECRAAITCCEALLWRHLQDSTAWPFVTEATPASSSVTPLCATTTSSSTSGLGASALAKWTGTTADPSMLQMRLSYPCLFEPPILVECVIAQAHTTFDLHSSAMHVP